MLLDASEKVIVEATGEPLPGIATLPVPIRAGTHVCAGCPHGINARANRSGASMVMGDRPALW